MDGRSVQSRCQQTRSWQRNQLLPLHLFTLKALFSSHSISFFSFMISETDRVFQSVKNENDGRILHPRVLMVFGYACPAYECYKAVEINRLEIEQLRFWCQYWILVAILSVLERVGDAFISWFPMHNEAKLAFYIYLWYPKTKGTTYIYQNLLQPFIEKHETEIDRNLLEFKTRTGGVMLQVWQKTAKYGQTRFFEILQDLASRYQSPQKHTVLVCL
ncbi:putative HVA22-like protein g isoform X1 [Zingiber officinale]|uniref:putative HVA22-like protein g isoform X1 n=1 Tax=Zingiber officinale TaxID=94328 RepID=UPI001C4A7E54|nr:putative HVA22-like protein g isoform X1 [Zingiber officinale]